MHDSHLATRASQARNGAIVRAQKRDNAEKGIILGLRGIGATVETWDRVDLVVGFRGRTFLLEVKNPDKAARKRATPRQLIFRHDWKGHYAIVSTPQEAIEHVQKLTGESAQA